MGRTVHLKLAQLVCCLCCHGAVALHDPARNLLIAIPGRILHNHAVLGLGGLLRSKADAVIVVQVLDRDLGAFLRDVVVARLRRALRHVHDGLLMEALRCPGDAAAMVAVRRREERGLAEVMGKLVGRQVVEVHLGDVLAGLLCDVAGHSKGAAEHLEGVEAEAVGLILDKEAAQAQTLCHAGKVGQGRHRILREALVEGTGLAHVLERHDLEVLVLALGHPVGNPLDFRLHAASSQT